MTLPTCASLILYGLAACTAPAPQDSVLVQYRRSGGIAGRTVTLVVSADGGARLTGRGTVEGFTVPADTLALLRELLGDQALDTLRDLYLPPHPGADRFQYDVTFRGRSVHTEDGAIPAALAPLVQLLGQLAHRRP